MSVTKELTAPIDFYSIFPYYVSQWLSWVNDNLKNVFFYVQQKIETTWGWVTSFLAERSL